MRNLIVILFLLIGSLGQLRAQIKVTSPNYVSFGTSTANGPFYVYGIHSKFKYTSANFLQLGLHAADPRIQSTNKIVFYNLNNNGYIDVEVRNLYQYSDLAAKTNIKPLSGPDRSALSRVMKLKGVSYQWKDGGDKSEQIGFIAQEVELAMPDLVRTNDSTGAKVVSYTNMIPYLVEAIKEQQLEIQALRNRIEKFSTTATKEE